MAIPTRSSPVNWGQNTSGTETNTPPGGDWSIANVAQYRNGSGGDWTVESPAFAKLIAVSYEANPDLWVENITWGTAELYLRNWTGGAWSWKLTGGGFSKCENSRNSSAFQSVGLPYADTSYTLTAHSGTGCASANLLDTETFSSRAANWKRPALSVSSLGTTFATLSIANSTGDWWYSKKSDPSTCTKVDAGSSSADLSGLTANTPYQYVAFSAAGCGIATVPLAWRTEHVSFVTFGTVSATATAQSETQVTLSVSGIDSGKWSFEHLHEDPFPVYSECSTYDHSTKSVEVTGLTSGMTYLFLVYRGATCSFKERITASGVTLSLSADEVGSSSATLRMENYDGDWHHKQAGGGQGASATGIRPKSSNGCSTAVSGATASLSGLTPSTDYTWKAYKAAGCADADEIASTSFTTLAEGQSPPDTGGGTGGGGSVGGGGSGGSGSSAPRTPEVRPAVASLSLASDPGPDYRYAAGRRDHRRGDLQRAGAGLHGEPQLEHPGGRRGPNRRVRWRLGVGHPAVQLHRGAGGPGPGRHRLPGGRAEGQLRPHP